MEESPFRIPNTAQVPSHSQVILPAREVETIVLRRDAAGANVKMVTGQVNKLETEVQWLKGVIFQPQWKNDWDGIEEDTSQWPDHHDIILIRHGDYDKAGTHSLTSLGMKQAETTGRYLQALVQRGELKIGHIFHSEKTRAAQTAKKINDQLAPQHILESSGLLNEGSLHAMMIRKMSNNPDWKRFDEAFAHFFKRKNDNLTTLIVCHANIIVYFITRLLQMPTEYEVWNHLDIHHCSLNQFRIFKTGALKLIHLNTIQHLQ